MARINHKAVFVAASCLLAFDMVAVAHAKAPSLASGQKHDKKAPIEITADTLEVYQAENRAVFKGHVVAIQADDRLKGDEMIVYYKNQEEQNKEKGKDKKSVSNAKTPDSKATDDKAEPDSNPMNAGAIKKIDVKGNVFLSTPQETASGDWGDYEVDNQLVHLNDHVVLTRGKNVLKGDKLVYNLDTGKSVVTSATGSQKPGMDTKKSQRVHALFVPENKTPNQPTTQPQAPKQP
jgi:lipopolysaccharide export system protein LptA